MTGRGKGDLVEKLIFPPPRFVGAALLPLVEAIGNDELAVHETWLAVRDSVEAELSRWSITDHLLGIFCRLSAFSFYRSDFDLINLNAGVIFDISRLLADQLQLSLCYDPDPGRLTLGIQVIVTIIKINNNNNISIIIDNNIILFMTFKTFSKEATILSLPPEARDSGQ